MTDTVETTVIQAIREVLARAGKSVEEVRLEQALASDLGLDSLDLAALVVSLEQQFGADPFRRGPVRARTVGDLIQTYREMTTTVTSPQ